MVFEFVVARNGQFCPDAELCLLVDASFWSDLSTIHWNTVAHKGEFEFLESHSLQRMKKSLKLGSYLDMSLMIETLTSASYRS